MILYSPHYKYAMFTTPKSGCTFSGLMFMLLHYKEYENDELNTEMERVLDLLDNTKTFTGCISLHPKIYNRAVELSKNLIKKHKPSHRFLVTRNPYNRAVSMYTDKYIYLDKERADRWGKENLPANLNFIQFLEESRNRGGLINSHHYQTQCNHVQRNLGVSDMTKLHKLKIENKDEGILNHYKTYIPDLDQNMLLDAIIESKKIPNRSAYGTETTNASRIIFYDKRLTHTKDSFLTRYTKNKIYDMYQEDFLKLGYEK